MRLKSIQMQGFKSFADKIYLDFNSGVTAIVGPNGSGKSNISDAIRWVMGEQSVKSLRGSKMEDVIFAGTESRKALGFAEVTLVLDNTDNYFPLDFPEISVTRRVYRSGEGEYYINKTLCRLRDIHELFMDTGLGRDGYSIIGQGKIDSILSTKSEDRRQIFEEAAGISKYKYRKIEAERKLVQTVDNLTRVRDILAELESQIEPLSRQSEKAKKYLVLRDELRGLDINVSIISVDKIKEELGGLSENIEILHSQIESIEKELSQIDDVISGMYDKMREYDAEITKYTEEERDITGKIGEAEKNIGILRNDIEHNISNIERLEIEIEHIGDSITDADKELLSHKERLAELNKESNLVTAETDSVSEKLAIAENTANEKGGELDKIRNEIIAVTSELNSLRGSVENFKILSDSFENRRNDITSELETGKRDIELFKTQLDSAIDEEQKIKKIVEDKEKELKQKEEELANKRVESAKLSENRNKHLLELSQKRSCRTMLMDMEREMEGYAKGVKGIMNAYSDGRLGNGGIHGPLAQLIRTDDKYVSAIETALGGAGQNIVTDSEAEAKRAIAYLKEKRLGRATLLPISSIKGRNFDKSSAQKHKGYVAVASELIECDGKYKNIVSSFLGTTVVCDNIDNAIAMARGTSHKFRIVTLGGDVIQAGGAMTGGSAVKSTGSISRSGEIETLAKDIESLKKICDEEESKLAEISEAIKQSDAAMGVLVQEVQKLQSELFRKSADKDRISALMENLNKTSSQAENEMTEINTRLAEIINDSEAKNKLIEENTKKRAELEEKAVKIQEEYSKAYEESEKLSAKLNELNIKRTAVLKDIELENERISAVTDSKGLHIESVNIKRNGIETLKNRNASIEEEVIANVKDTEKYRERVELCRKNVADLNQQRLEKEEEIRKKQSEVKEVQENKFTLSQRASKLESRAEKLTSDRENIINRMWEDYELTYSDALELKSDEEFDYKEATLKIKELKDKIKSLGNINIDSIEEYKSVKERFDFLTVQTQDLEKAKAELDSVIDEMMEIMQNRFAEQFKIINVNFNKVFSQLFGGGRATLSLTDPDNVLESGIEIEAQPPGKKLQSLTLLSGGERAFTAIALLFAILDVRPTPFCILDEIEAALDDVNVYRYADYLKKYSDKTQFIVVTHRRGTMEAANILYGVTMQERGVSKLLTLNIDEVKE